jgi:hypothetical protein
MPLGDICQPGKQGKQPCLRIQERFNHSVGEI